MAAAPYPAVPLIIVSGHHDEVAAFDIGYRRGQLAQSLVPEAFRTLEIFEWKCQMHLRIGGEGLPQRRLHTGISPVVQRLSKRGERNLVVIVGGHPMLLNQM